MMPPMLLQKIYLRNSIPFISVKKSLFLESFIESFIIQNMAFNGVIAKQLVFAKIDIHRICSSYSGFVTYLLRALIGDLPLMLLWLL